MELSGLAADLSLDTSFIEKYMQRIFPVLSKQMPWNSRPIDTIMRFSKARSAVSLAVREYTKASADEPRHKILVPKPVTLASCSHKLAIVPSTCSELLIIEPKLYVNTAQTCK